MKKHQRLWRLAAVVTALGVLGGSGNYVYAQENTSVQSEAAEVTFTDNLSANAYGRDRYDYSSDTIKSLNVQLNFSALNSKSPNEPLFSEIYPKVNVISVESTLSNPAKSKAVIISSVLIFSIKPSYYLY